MYLKSSLAHSAIVVFITIVLLTSAVVFTNNNQIVDAKKTKKSHHDNTSSNNDMIIKSELKAKIMQLEDKVKLLQNGGSNKNSTTFDIAKAQAHIKELKNELIQEQTNLIQSVNNIRNSAVSVITNSTSPQ